MLLLLWLFASRPTHGFDRLSPEGMFVVFVWVMDYSSANKKSVWMDVRSRGKRKLYGCHQCHSCRMVPFEREIERERKADSDEYKSDSKESLQYLLARSYLGLRPLEDVCMSSKQARP